MANGAVTVELIVDIPADRLEAVKQDFKDEGFTVETQQQGSGLWSVAAAKCD